jgi:hypothetical protein
MIFWPAMENPSNCTSCATHHLKPDGPLWISGVHEDHEANQLMLAVICSSCWSIVTYKASSNDWCPSLRTNSHLVDCLSAVRWMIPLAKYAQGWRWSLIHWYMVIYSHLITCGYSTINSIVSPSWLCYLAPAKGAEPPSDDPLLRGRRRAFVPWFKTSSKADPCRCFSLFLIVSRCFQRMTGGKACIILIGVYSSNFW